MLFHIFRVFREHIKFYRGYSSVQINLAEEFYKLLNTRSALASV